MSSNFLWSLINRLKEEYQKYYYLIKKITAEKIYQKIEIMKIDLRESEQTINILKEEIKNYIKKYRNIIELQENINLEKNVEKTISEKNKKLTEFIEKGKNILTKDITFYKKLPNYSNKKLMTAKISPLDLINFTLRLSQQNKAPNDDEYFLKYLPLNDKQNPLYNDYFLKNQNRYLYPYPDDFFGMKNTILRYDLSEKNRLLPPVLDSNLQLKYNEKGEIISNKGKDIIFKYPKENPPPGITFKYSKDPNILPSFFTGEEYKYYSHPNLDKDCTIKVCTCRKGYKDSKIVSFKFIIDTNDVEKFVEKKVDTRPRIDVVEATALHIDSGGLAFGPQSPISSNSPQRNTSRPGTSSYEPNYFNPENLNDEDDEDEI
jgi:hypothetical protein